LKIVTNFPFKPIVSAKPRNYDEERNTFNVPAYLPSYNAYVMIHVDSPTYAGLQENGRRQRGTGGDRARCPLDFHI